MTSWEEGFSFWVVPPMRPLPGWVFHQDRWSTCQYQWKIDTDQTISIFTAHTRAVGWLVGPQLQRRGHVVRTAFWGNTGEGHFNWIPFALRL